MKSFVSFLPDLACLVIFEEEADDESTEMPLAIRAITEVWTQNF